MSDVNVTEKVARALGEHRLIGNRCRCGLDPRLDYYRYERHVATAALSALADPEVLVGVRGVLREHSESKGDASFLPSCRCGWVGSSRMAWVADLARHQTAALADWLRGQG